MVLILTIENAEHLPGRTPKTCRLPERGRLDIGRNASAVDWVLPDPARFISGKHCEIRWRAGAFWLYDVSTNGTFVNGQHRRIATPHILKAGDRIAIGPYLLTVAINVERPSRSGAVATGSAHSLPLRTVTA
jgi:type VI secretion system protein ImpI